MLLSSTKLFSHTMSCIPTILNSSSQPTTPPTWPANTSAYSWGVTLLFDIESDPLEEHDLSSSMPKIVLELSTALAKYNATMIDQDVMHGSPTGDTESCSSGTGKVLACAVPWLPSLPGPDRCRVAPTAPPTTAPPTKPTPGTNCCQCLQDEGGTACEAMCSKKGAACTQCIVKGGGRNKCRKICGCK